MNETKHIGLRVSVTDLDLIESISKARGENLSAFFRRAIKRELTRFGHLSPEEWKALEVTGD